MRFRTKLFVTSGVVVLLLWAAMLWPIQQTIWASFDQLADANFAQTRLSMHTLQKEGVERMQLAGRMVMQSPDLRSLIAEKKSELESSPQNQSSLQERLDNLTDVTEVEFAAALDGDAELVAQNSSSPWKSLDGFTDYARNSPQVQQLLRSLFAPADPNRQDRAEYGVWVYGGRLYQVVGVPLIFSSGNGALARPDGAMVMATPMTDDLANMLGDSHACDITFLAGDKILASSLPEPQQVQLLTAYQPKNWPVSKAFDLKLDSVTYRAFVEPLIDPCSGSTVGQTIIQSSLADAQAMQRRVLRTLLAIMTGGLAAAAAISFFLSGAVTKPVRELVAGVRRVADGDLNSHIRAGGRDELGELGRAFNDMVVQVRNRQELEKLVEASQSASKAKSQFLANMSHEIRTPLHGVIGMTNLLLGTELTARQRHYATLVKSSTEVLTTLINDILDFSKIEAGKLELESVAFSVARVVEEVVELLSAKAFEKGLEMGADIRADVPELVMGDPNRLRQILINLIGNAVKFTGTGEIIVAVRRQEGPGVQLRFEVRDTGIGIPADRRERLFKSFSQVDASTTRKYGGTGLGLAISGQLSELMGGGIGVESEDGRGSTFWFTVKFEPLNTAKPARAKGLPGVRALVVDENAAIRGIIQRQLIDEGAEAETAATTEEAARALAEARIAGQPFGVLLVDRRLRGLTSLVSGDPSSISRVLLTTAGDDLRGNEKTVGFAANVVKPVRHGPLLQAVAGALGRQVSTSEETATSDSDITPVKSGKNYRILIAEDNEVNQLVAAELLAKAGYQTRVVGNGQSAVDAARREAFDLILMDCQMPVMDGFEATRAIRQSKSPIPIIALTANASGADRSRCIEAGMNDYCGKPFKARELLGMIESLLADRPTDDVPPVAVAETPAAENPLDARALLDNCSGNPSLAMKVLEKFEKQAKDALAQIENCVRDKQAEQIAKTSHALKGTAGTVSAESLRRAAAAMEKIGRSNLLDEAAAGLAELQREVDRCLGYLPQIRVELQTASESPAKETANV